MADSFSAVGTNALKLVGDGASGIGPYTKFGTVVLTAIKVTSTTTNFTTTPEAANSNLYKAVKALQMGAEVFYVGKPTASGSNNFVALVNSATLQRGGRGASASAGQKFISNLDKRGTKSQGNGFRSRIMYPQTKKNLPLIEQAIEVSIRKIDGEVQKRLNG